MWIQAVRLLFQVNVSKGVFKEIQKMRGKYVAGDTKLQLAKNLTDEQFQTKVNLLLVNSK